MSLLDYTYDLHLNVPEALLSSVVPIYTRGLAALGIDAPFRFVAVSETLFGDDK